MYRALYTVGVVAISVLLLGGDFYFLSDVIAGASLGALVVNTREHRIRCGLMHLNRHLPGLDVPASIDCMRPQAAPVPQFWAANKDARARPHWHAGGRVPERQPCKVTAAAMGGKPQSPAPIDAA